MVIINEFDSAERFVTRSLKNDSFTDFYNEP